MCQIRGVEAQVEGEVTIVGVDLAKDRLHPRRAAADGSVVFYEKLLRP
jgi:hypothetical protein